MNYLPLLTIFTAVLLAAPVNANTVSFIQTPFTSATMSTADGSTGFTAQAGSSSANPSPGLYAFEIENSANPYWNSNGGPIPFEGGFKTRIDGSFNLQASAGYQITSVYMGAGGLFQSTNGAPASVFMEVTDSESNFSWEYRTFTSSGVDTENSRWKFSSPTFSYLAGLNALSGRFSFDFDGSPCELCTRSSFIYGTNDEMDGAFPNATVVGPLYRGPTLYVSVEQSVSAVPEPHEWAMMLSGMALVGAIAKRNRNYSSKVTK
jgi:hypothetical protein